MTTCHPPWFDPARPQRDEAVLPFMLERNAKEVADHTCFRFADGSSWTHGETLIHTRRAAAALAARGVTRGDLVLCWLPNGPAAIRTWFGLNYLGAVFVPMNLDYRGSLLAHAIKETGAKVIVAHPGLIDRLKDIDTANLETVLAVPKPDGDEALIDGMRVVATDLSDGSEINEPADLQVWDPQMVIFTSGTTGPSKGVVCPYLHQFTVGKGCYGYMTARDCILIDLPMFHVGGVSPVMAGITKQASIALYDGFSTTEFWSRIEANTATTTSGLIGSMASFLVKAPPQPDEADNSLRMVTLMLNEQAIQAAERYNFSYTAGFNMSELSVPLVTEVNCKVAGSIGKPRTGCECRVVDEHDYEVEPGVVGELIVRTDQPWETSTGYLNQPGATAAAWRNGWFHTGDLVRRDADGNFFFVDRLKDAVRRRGENVSSLEVESEVLSHDAVGEAAVVGVPSEHGEEEILVAVVPKPGCDIDPRDLAEYLIPRMPHYMVPRYVRIMDALPKTPTNKLQKFAIRDAGITPDTWDREAAGIRLKKTRLQQ